METIQQLREELAEYKIREKHMSSRIEELSDFIENAALPLHWVDGQGTIVWANQAELDALGYSKEEYIGAPISKFHADEQVIEDILNRLINNETLENYKARLKCKDGSIKHVLISSNVLRKNGEFIHTRCFTRDITALVLEEQRKNDFVALVSHELKTPLTSILSYVQMLLSKARKTEDNFGIQSLIRTEVQVKRMTNMINDFLNVGRLEQAQIQLSKTEFELHVLIQEIIQENQLLQSTHNIECHHCQAVTIYADRDKIGQVISNLISNAIKYSPQKNTVIVSCEIIEESVKISVIDKGVGINKKDQQQVFQRFYRVQDERIKNISGFGIGLYLVSEILRYHGTTIAVQSEAGKGSTFSFSLPFIK